MKHWILLVALNAACGGAAGDSDDDSRSETDVDAGAGSGGGDDDASPEVTCEPALLEPDCTPGWYDDQECDPSNNFEACEWDGGDCCPASCAGAGCGDYGFDCRDPEAGGGGVPEPALIGDPCAVVADPFAPGRLEEEVALLSSDALAGRRPGSTGDLTTRRYIEERFRCLGLEPAVDGCYQQPFHNGDGDPTANLVGIIPGTDLAGETIVIGAHHDHLGVIAGQPHNGANDNASGVAALLAIIDQIQRAPTAPRRTLVFVAFGSEESGLEGSIHYAATPPTGLGMENVVYMINLDMLGTYEVVNGVDAFGTFAGTPGRALVEEMLPAHPDLAVALGVASPDDDSDYDAFCEAGIPYVYFETFDPPCWHEACDDSGRMDFAHMAELVEILLGVAVGLANSDEDLAAVRDEVGCP